jgi:hypothetical protein
LTFILEDDDYKDLDTIELLPLNTKEFTSFSSHLNMDSIYVVTDETVKMFPGLEERFISKADILYNIENYQQKVFRSEFNLDIFFPCWSHFFLNSPKGLSKH